MKKLVKTEEEYDDALGRIGELMSAGRGTPEGDELELLATLVELYEKKHWAIAPPNPIEAIKFRMEQQGLSRRDLVPYIGSANRVSEILNGKRSLSLKMIQRLHEGLGIPADSLLAFQEAPNLMETGPVADVERYPFSEMVKRGWFPTFRESKAKSNAESLLAELLAHLHPSQAEPALLRQHVRSGSTMNPYALNAWLARASMIAEGMDLRPYLSGTINRQFMQRLVGLSLLDEGPRLAAELLAQNGIAMIALTHLPKTHLDGAALMTSSGRPVVAVTLRHDRLDNFWFTLCHELAHISRHLEKSNKHDIFVDDLRSDGDKLEVEADSTAAAWLIPQRAWNAADLPANPTASGAIQLAEELRIHPAIVAGRVRRETKNYRLLARLVGSKKVRCLFDGLDSGWSLFTS
ncbi:MAG: HTH-type transcriptional regulator/antitoxin HigA [Planctomycetota bacterium]|jgi:HTH-type transcriptional regulator/antitoxin HigA